jgi:hypothetical protein
MRGRILVILMLAAATAARPQAAPDATGEMPTNQMMTPPPVSGTAYPTAVGSEARTNYLSGSFTYTAAYINNLYPGGGTVPLAETSMSVLPTVAYDTTTARRHMSVRYSPGFTFFQPTGALNEFEDSASGAYNLNLTRHTSLSASDSFQDSSYPFNPLGAGSSATVSGSPTSLTPSIVPPFAKMLTNSTNVELSAQTGLNVMVGISGQAAELHYPDPAQAAGLYNSNSRGGSAFYNRRISSAQYFGAQYQYMDSPSNPPSGTGVAQTTPASGGSTTQSQTISGFYTFSPTPHLSMSVTGGPQYYKVIEPPLPATGSWGPSVSASVGWQGVHTNFSASYMQSVTGGGGLLGAFHTMNVNAVARWQMARTWTTSASGSYSDNKTVSALLFSSGMSGHFVSGIATLDHSLGGQLSISVNYNRIHESYEGIAAIAVNPDSDREAISIIWHFERPVGR